MPASIESAVLLPLLPPLPPLPLLPLLHKQGSRKQADLSPRDSHRAELTCDFEVIVGH